MAAQPALALEKCVGADGKVSYSDKPCPAGAKRAAVTGSLSGSAVAGPAGASILSSPTPIQYEYYDVAAPGGHQGRADWKVSYKLSTRQQNGGCAIERLSTELSLKIRMPRLNSPAGANTGLMSKWQSYLSALEAHEQGHLQHGRDMESTFLGAARAMRAENCTALQAAVRTRYDELLRQAAQRDVDYDRQTRHGATQGATF